MIDTHCHIDLYPHPTKIATKANQARVLTVMVTNLPSAFEKSYPYVREFNRIRIALGLHPLLAAQHFSERERFRRLVDKTSYIGEVGLDFSRDGYKTKEIQIDSFKFVLRALNNRRKFITLHSRRAESAVLDVLEEMNYPFPVVFHWFSGPLNILDRALQEGHYFSINPAMTESLNGRKIIDRIPHTQLLTETDGPFVKIGSRTIEPGDINLIERYLSNKWNVSSDVVSATVRENFMKIVNPIRSLQK